MVASIFLSFTGSLAEKLNMDPLLIMIPVTLSAALSFALPISTPPNAIAYATGVFTQFELLKVGGFLTLFGTQFCLSLVKTASFLYLTPSFQYLTCFHLYGIINFPTHMSRTHTLAQTLT